MDFDDIFARFGLKNHVWRSKNEFQAFPCISAHSKYILIAIFKFLYLCSQPPLRINCHKTNHRLFFLIVDDFSTFVDKFSSKSQIRHTISASDPGFPRFVTIFEEL